MQRQKRTEFIRSNLKDTEMTISHLKNVNGATLTIYITYAKTYTLKGCPRGVMVKAMDSGIVVYEFVLQSRYYVHFRANTLGKGMNPFILPAIG